MATRAPFVAGCTVHSRLLLQLPAPAARSDNHVDTTVCPALRVPADMAINTRTATRAAANALHVFGSQVRMRKRGFMQCLQASAAPTAGQALGTG